MKPRENQTIVRIIDKKRINEFCRLLYTSGEISAEEIELTDCVFVFTNKITFCKYARTEGIYSRGYDTIYEFECNTEITVFIDTKVTTTQIDIYTSTIPTKYLLQVKIVRK